MTTTASLLDRRVLIVVGKGGVGKSVIAAALGLRAARAGRRAVIAEMNGAESMATLFDRAPVGYAGAALAKNLTGLSICPDNAVEEYLIRMLKFRLLYEVVFRNRYIQPFMNGVMGLSDLISIGKVMDLEWSRADGSRGPDPDGPPAYDLVVVDAPSTGHGLSLLRSPQAIMDITRAGPLFSNARMIRDLLADRERCGVVLVTNAEEMVINETIELAGRLRSEVAIDIAGVVVNGLAPHLFEGEGAEAEGCWEELRAFGTDAGGRAGRAVADAERSLRDRQRAEVYIRQLREQLELPIAEVPLLSRRDLDAEALVTLGQHLRWVQ